MSFSAVLISSPLTVLLASTTLSESSIAAAPRSHRSGAAKLLAPTPVHEALSQHQSNDSVDVTAGDKDASGLLLPTLHCHVN
jgi:hypothetical protein